MMKQSRRSVGSKHYIEFGQFVRKPCFFCDKPKVFSMITAKPRVLVCTRQICRVWKLRVYIYIYICITSGFTPIPESLAGESLVKSWFFCEEVPLCLHFQCLSMVKLCWLTGRIIAVSNMNHQMVRLQVWDYNPTINGKTRKNQA